MEMLSDKAVGISSESKLIYCENSAFSAQIPQLGF